MKNLCTVIFNSESPYWGESGASNVFYVRYILNHFNDVLKVKGYVFLKDIFENLGMPVTRESIIAGWVYPQNEKIVLNYTAIDDGPDIKITFSFEKDIRDNF